jgi:hypothetical protein
MKGWRCWGLILAVAGIAVMLAADGAMAQCAMCKASIEASTNAAQVEKGLNLASLVLLIPPVSIFAGLFGAIYRFRNVQGGRQSRSASRDRRAR